MHFFSNSKSIENDSDNINSTSPNHELINKSDSPQSSSGTIRKNVGTRGGEKKKKSQCVKKKYHSYYLKFEFIKEPDNELDPWPLCAVCSKSLCNDD
ncbi:DUF4371 domain-containing protein [Trichonephila clavata]|uniref:DUF4371 domain-containing protein n=1 Tax=Trichonephila clavata TaxID=2740835 RepID=A0A8X6FGL5_TRICU|nr:DUF4371 domain-containing protein [Trichonephila clavata]